jgi:CRP-like cAMP-binding protein
MPTDLLIRKLRLNSRLGEDDADAVRALPFRSENVDRGETIIREGDRPGQCCIVLSGFLYRSKVGENGRRQILSFHPAGDMPDLQSLFLKAMDHDLAALSDSRLAFVDHKAVLNLIDQRPAVARALWRESIVDAAIFREWIVNLGTRDAVSRMAHLVAEMRERLAALGLAADEEFRFPVTQRDLADALGLSTVHVNRVLQELRVGGVINIHKQVVSLGDLERLITIGGFDPQYLHQFDSNSSI